MTEEYTIPLSRIIKELSLREVHMPKTAEEILIVSRDVIRPAWSCTASATISTPSASLCWAARKWPCWKAWAKRKKAEAIDHFFRPAPRHRHCGPGHRSLRLHDRRRGAL